MGSEPSALTSIGVLRNARGDVLLQEASYRVVLNDHRGRLVKRRGARFLRLE